MKAIVSRGSSQGGGQFSSILKELKGSERTMVEAWAKIWGLLSAQLPWGLAVMGHG